MEQDTISPVDQCDRPETSLPETSVRDQWARVGYRLRSEVGEVEYRSWLRQMMLVGVDGDEVTVLRPTRFLRDWVRERYGDRLTALWQAENRLIRRCDIRVAAASAGPIGDGGGLPGGTPP